MDEDFEPDEEFEIYPERFNKWVFLRAGLEFTAHVLGGAQCALNILARQVIAAEVFDSERKNFEESVRADMEMLPEGEE